MASLTAFMESSARAAFSAIFLTESFAQKDESLKSSNESIPSTKVAKRCQYSTSPVALDNFC
nr:MAG TPA: hypothetical protein [Caudoviricetes sp.]